MLRLLLPAYQQAAKPIEPTMTAFDDPAPCPLARFTGDLLRFLAATANVRREAKFAQGCAHVVIIIAFIQSHALRSLLRRRRSLHDHRSMVAHTRFISWRLAPSIATPMGTPCPSVSTDRLTLAFPRSVGLEPVVFSPSGALVIAPSMLSQSQSMPFGSSMSIPVFRIGSMEICFRSVSTR